MELVGVLAFLILGVGLSIAVIYLTRKKVIQYIGAKYGSVDSLNVKWTMAGPWAPGRGNHKFYVTFQDKNGTPHSYFAVSSLFGDVFLREGKETPFNQ